MEEGIEAVIAFALSSALAIFFSKLLSMIAIITATQGAKITIQRVIAPFIKNLIYKEGNDKVNKFIQVLKWLNANKCTILGVITGSLVAVSGAGVIDISALPIMVGEFNITPVLYYSLLGVLTVLASFFPETIEKFMARVMVQKAESEEKKIEREALNEIKSEQKAAEKTATEHQNALAKEEAKAKADADKMRLENERAAKVRAAKAKLLFELQQQQNQKP